MSVPRPSGFFQPATQGLDIDPDQQLVFLEAVEAGIVPTLDWIEGNAIAPHVKTLTVLDHSQPGDGGGSRWRREEEEPTYPLKRRSLDRFTLSGVEDFENGGWWSIILQGDETNVLQNGADPTGQTDSTAAIQDVIDENLYRLHGTTVLTPGNFQISSLMIGYGEFFNQGFMRGAGRRYRAEEGLSGAGLIGTQYDTFMLGTQASRSSRMTDMALVGPAKDALVAFIGDDSSMLDRENWYQALRDAGFSGVDEVNAPSCAVAFGPYSGPTPASPYPNRVFPDYTGITQNYGKGQDSGSICERLYLFGHENAFVVGPAGDGNHDFIEGRDCLVDRCVIAVSVGPTQARRTAMPNLDTARVHTVVTNRKHGVAQGRFDALWPGLTVGGMVVQIFDLGAGSTGGTITFQNLYAESLSRLGEMYGANSLPSVAVVIRDSSITWNATASDAYVVGSVIKGTPNDQVVIENTRFRSRSAVSFGTVDMILRHCLNVPDEPVKAYQRAALNALSGGLIPDLTENPPFVSVMRTYDIDNGGVNAQGATDKRHKNSRRHECIPHAMTEGRCFGFGEWSDKLMPTPPQTPAQQLSITLTGRTLSMVNTNLSSSNTDRPYQRACLPGCVWVHVESGTVFFVRSADPVTGQMHLEMQNNYRFNGTDYEILDTAYDPQNATYFCVNALVYAPERALTGDVTEGSPIITNVRDALNGAPLPDFGLQVGDRFADEYYPYPTFVGVGSNRLEIQAIDTAARTITLAGAFTYTGRIPLNFWYRQPPPNEASR